MCQQPNVTNVKSVAEYTWIRSFISTNKCTILYSIL